MGYQRRNARKNFMSSRKRVAKRKKVLENDDFIRAIGLGIRQCVMDHGPITEQYVGSAAKRVFFAIEQRLSSLRTYVAKDVAPEVIEDLRRQIGLLDEEIKRQKKIHHELYKRYTALKDSVPNIAE
jgi:hypothetical protein